MTMSEDVAVIGIAVETKGIEAATRALDDLASRGAKVESSVKGIEGSTAKAGRSISDLGNGSKSAASDMTKMAQETEKAGQAASNASKGFKDVSGGFDLLKTAVGGYLSINAVQSVIAMADSITTLKTSLSLSAVSAKEAGKAYEELFNIAQRSRTSFTELGATYATISRAGAELGVSQTRLLKVTEAIGNAMTIGGGSAQSMKAALVQLGQGLSSGTLRGEELNSILEQTPRLAKALADGMGVSTGELRKLGEAGALTGKAVIDALEKSSVQLAKEVQGATVTVGQAFTKLSNSTTKFVGDADKASGASAALASAMTSASESIDVVSSSIKNNETAFAVITYGLAGPATIAGIYALSGAITTRLIPALGAAAVAAGPLGWIAIALGAIGGAAVAAGNAFTKSAQGMAADSAKLAGTIAAIDKAIIGGLDHQGEKIDDSGKRKMAAMRQSLVEKKKLIDQDIALNLSIGIDTSAEDARFARGTAAFKEREEAMKAFKDAGSHYLTDAAKHQATLNKEIETARTAFEMGSISAKDYADRINAVQASFAKKGGSHITEAAKGLALYNDLMATSVKVNANYTEEQAKLNAARKADTLSVDQYNAATQALVAKQPYMVEMAKEATKTFDEEAKARDKATEAYIKQLDARAMADADVAQMAGDYGRTVDDANQRAALELSLMYESSTARDITLAQYDIELKLQKQILEIKQKLASLPEQNAAIASVTATAARESLAVASKVQNAEWSKSVQQYNDIFRTGFADMINGGEGAWKSFTKSLVTTFKTSVADQIYKMFAQPFVMSIVGSFLGMAGLSMADGAAAQGSGGSSVNALSTAGNLATLYDKISNGMSAGVVSGFGKFAASGAGQAMGLTTQVAGPVTSTGQAATAYTSTGSSISSALPMMTWIAAGMAADSAMYDKGWRAKTADFNLMGNILDGGSSIVVDKIGRALGMSEKGASILSGSSLSTYLFGMKQAEIQSQGTRGTLSDAGFSGQNYTNIHQEGGLFRSNKDWTETSAVSSATSDVLSAAFAGTKTAIADLAVSLGLSTDKIAGYTKTIDIAAGTSNKAIADMFVGMGDEMSAQLLANKTGQVGAFDEQYYLAQNPDVRDKSIWSGTAKQHFDYGGRNEGRAQNAQSMVSTGKDYTYLQRQIKDAKTGDMVQETATQTLTRLSDSLKGANTWLAVLDHSLISVSMDGAEAATKLSDLFGGDAKMAEANKSYYDNFWSDSEKLADTTLNVSKGLALVGQAMPASKDAFRDVVSGLDLTTDAGRSTYAVMLSLAPEFAQVADAAASAAIDLAKAQADAAKEANDAMIAAQKATADQADGLLTQWLQLTGDTVALRKQELAAIEGVNQAMQQQIWAYQDAQDALTAASTASDSALNGIQKSLDAQKTSQTAAVTAVKGVFDLLKSEIDKLYGQVASTTAMAASEGNAFIETAMALAKAGGVMPDQAALGKASAAVQSGFGNEATQFEADRSRLVLAGQLQQLKDIAGPQLTDAEAQLAATNDAYTVAKTQLDTLRGINDSTLSVAAAVEAFQVAFTGEATARQKLAAAASPVTSGAGVVLGEYNPNYISGIVAWNKAQLGVLQSAAEGMANSPGASSQLADITVNALQLINFDAAAATAAYNANYSASTISTATQLATARGLPSFAVGTDYVPNDMIAQIHKGEQIVPAAFNPTRFSASSSNDALVAEIRALREEVKQLRENNDAGQQAIASNTMQSAKLHKRWDGDGIPATRTTV